MNSQSSQLGAVRPATEAGNESIPPDSPLQAKPSFVWDGRDVGHASLIAFALAFVRQHDHAHAILDSSLDLQYDPPRTVDAWRFFHAARLLATFSDTSIAAQARLIGARIATATTGLTVVDGTHVECGSQAVYVWRARVAR